LKHLFCKTVEKYNAYVDYRIVLFLERKKHKGND